MLSVLTHLWEHTIITDTKAGCQNWSYGQCGTVYAQEFREKLIMLFKETYPGALGLYFNF